MRAVRGGGDLAADEPAGRSAAGPGFPQPWLEAARRPERPAAVQHLTGEATLNYTHTEC